MKRSPVRREQGQSLVIIALSLIALVAFVALAVDGGNMYSQRRAAQNAADAAAVRGTYELWKMQTARNFPDSPANQSALAAAINLAAESHGVPDTNPAVEINGNIVGYYTNTHGEVLMDNGQPCRVNAACSGGVIRKAWGVKVDIVKPFNTYFASIIGWSQAQVAANAVAVTHVGASFENERFAIFSDANACNGNTVDLSGSSITVNGNIHSNRDLKFNPSGSGGTVVGYMTYVDTLNCPRCGANLPQPPYRTERVTRINNMVYPSVNALHDLVKDKATELGQFYPGSQCVGAGGNCNNTFPVVNGRPTIGTPEKPYTFIQGNLDIRNNSNVQWYGIIFVAGHVDVNASGIRILDYYDYDDPQWNFATCGGAVGQRLTIVAMGDIDVNQASAAFIGAPFNDPAEPLLAENTIMLYSSKQGANCSDQVISFSGSANNVFGSFLAPKGRITISGSTNVIKGSLVGQEVHISGSSQTIDYRETCFPPQPDYIELIQ